MAKLWSKPRKIEVYKRSTRQMVAEFIADDAYCSSPINTFYLNEKKVYWYNERECFYKSFELESEE